MDENLDESTIHEIEGVLGTKIYPGTEIMKDVGSHHFVKGANHRSVLVPQPSDDPRDPLNWSPFWKSTTIFAATAVSFSLNLGPLALAPMFDYYIEAYKCSLADVVQFTGVAILVLGFSNFIWVPMSTCFGRRPVAILSSLICAFSSVWRARATSYGSFMGACVLNGLGAGPCETLMPQVIADIIFLHDRGKYQTLYFSLYFISLMVGPVISGAMALNTGVESFWWFNTGMLFFTSLVCIFLFPETRYHHRDSQEKGHESTLEDTSTHASAGGAAGMNSLAHAETHIDPYLGRGGPGRAQFLPIQPYAGGLLRELWLPLYLHLYPVVEFAAFVVSWSASGFLVVNLSQAQVFAAPPYNFSSQTIGLFNLAVLVGGLVGLFTCGPLSDWVAAHLTARNNGVREPEMRLVAMVPYIIIMIIGSVITAVGYDRHWPWQVIVIIGYSFLGIQVAALPSIASTYAIDSYKPITGSVFVIITINKNLWGYGVSKFITPWSIANGFVPPMLTNMALITLFSCSGIIFWFFGKKFRGMTSKSFVHKL
ncbi:MFS general substrate transporter [Cryphonectria parasitica EP155]|uniref:MFS general substrate transporter n=1 Tax=Cryphonectria parasitica (strain ATCC 38755 / EP155) TaxID=660469 RepID=A0A9P4XTM1_CRYP1|nr:MFS general substrate transporter [Cryphonectria parasitica EP155]KAF3760708.1 MFS general substrate transporter [Cryphonectria parasitica EP155]